MKKSMKCDCRSNISIKNVEIMTDLSSEGYKCNKCGKTEFTEDQMRLALKKKEETEKKSV